MSGSMERQARLESMRGMMPGTARNQAHNSFVFRRHLDFSRECERKVYMYARETRFLVSKIDRFQKELMDKQRELENPVEGPNTRGTQNHIANKHHVDVTPPKLHKDKKDTLLFRVRHQAGEKVYIREQEHFPSLSSNFNPFQKLHSDKLNRNRIK